MRSLLCSGLREIEDYWSMDDLVDAHQVLDMEDELERAKLAAESAEMNHGSPT